MRKTKYCNVILNSPEYFALGIEWITWEVVVDKLGVKHAIMIRHI